MALSFTVHLIRNVLFGKLSMYAYELFNGLTLPCSRAGVVMLWTLIVFALLIHFQQLVIPSELSEFFR